MLDTAIYAKKFDKTVLVKKNANCYNGFMHISLKPLMHRNSSCAKGVQSTDMTVGNPFKLILTFAMPIILGNLFQNLYSMVDSIIVGRLLGTNALAAVGNTGPFTFLVLGFVLGLTSGFAVCVAQAFGAKDELLLKYSVAQNIKLNLLAAIFFTVVGVLTAKPLLRLVNTPEQIFNDSFTYISIIYGGIGATVLYNACACILRAVGDSKIPLYFLILSSILNIFLDIVFIKTFEWGISGAALATIISQAISGILSLVVIIKKYPMLHVQKCHFEPKPSLCAKHLKLGFPMAFQFSITAIGVIVLQGALNKFGADTIAAYSAANKVEQLIAVAAGSFGMVMANFAGQNYGAGNIARIKQGTIAGTVLTVAFSLLAMFIALVFPEQLTALFVQKSSPSFDAIVADARTYLTYTGIFYPVLFVIFIFRNVLQAMGKSFMPLMGGVFELVARSVASFTLPVVAGYLGICLAGPLAWASAALPLAIATVVILSRLSKSAC